MINKPTSRAAIITMLAAVTVGCQQSPPASVNTVGPAERRAVPTPVADERLITDEIFANAAIITGLIEGTTPDGLRVIEAEVQNATTGHVPFRYRTSWYDDRGMEVRGATVVWRHVVLPPGAFRRVTAVAPSVAAHDFRMEFYSDR
jgi:uncharacterized protein YcfL